MIDRVIVISDSRTGQSQTLQKEHHARDALDLNGRLGGIASQMARLTWLGKGPQLLLSSSRSPPSAGQI